MFLHILMLFSNTLYHSIVLLALLCCYLLYCVVTSTSCIVLLPLVLCCYLLYCVVSICIVLLSLVMRCQHLYGVSICMVLLALVWVSICMVVWCCQHLYGVSICMVLSPHLISISRSVLLRVIIFTRNLLYQINSLTLLPQQHAYQCYTRQHTALLLMTRHIARAASL